MVKVLRRARVARHPDGRNRPEWLGTVAEVAVVLLAIGAFVGVFAVVLVRAADTPAPPASERLAREDRNEIMASTCRELWASLPGYEANADSVQWGVDGVKAIIERSEQLGCNPALSSDFAD